MPECLGNTPAADSDVDSRREYGDKDYQCRYRLCLLLCHELPDMRFTRHTS